MMCRIVIADDENAERQLLRDILERHFAQTVDIRCVENGRQAVTMVTISEADIVLMDIEMPGISGLEAARRIRKENPEVKLIFITAFPLFSYAQEALKLGASDYILKPVNSDDVIAAVTRAIGQREAERQLSQVAAATIRAPEEVEGANQLIGKVKKYLQHNYMTVDISLDSVSNIVNLNPTYFSALFKKETGVNFLDYLTDLRIQAARTLLTDPLRSTGEIASMVGYDSAGYFARAFKKRTGMTPTEYRKKCGKDIS